MPTLRTVDIFLRWIIGQCYPRVAVPQFLATRRTGYVIRVRFLQFAEIVIELLPPGIEINQLFHSQIPANIQHSLKVTAP